MAKVKIELEFDTKNEIDYNFISEVIKVITLEDDAVDTNGSLIWKNRNIYAYKLKTKWKVILKG